MTASKRLLAVLAALTLALSAVATAMAEGQAATTAPTQKAEATNLRKEIVRLKNVRALDIQSLLLAYTGREGHIQAHPNMPSVLVISDTPENVERILAAVRELDVRPPDVLYTVQLVLGSEAEASTDPELQTDPIIKELRRLLRYKGYKLLDGTFLRLVNRGRGVVKFGPEGNYQLALMADIAGDPKSPLIKTELSLEQARTSSLPAVKTEVVTLISSAITIKSGDRTVVGVSKLDGGDKGLILIISGKIVD